MAMDKKKYSPLPESEETPPPAYETAQAELSQLTSRTATVEQPIPMPQMRIGGSRNPKSLEVGLDGKRRWTHSLLSCHERPALTAGAFCCPCVVYSSNHSRLTHLTHSGQPDPSPQHIGLWCCLYSLSPQIFGVGQIAMQCFARFQTRSRYGIRGSPVHDVLVSAFCPTCSLVQESREIEEEEQALRAGGPAPETFYRDEEEAVAAPEQ
ncbi:hypothetical protein JCM5296_004860 [Sporobolomyces johnsonii]